MHDIIFFKTRKTKTVIKMLRTEYDIRLVTLVRRIFFIIYYTHTFFFYILRFVQNTLQYPAGKNIFNLHQLVMQNKALMFYYLSKI